MKELICICCPNGCHLKVDPDQGYAVTGNQCPRGEEYGKSELINPMRVVTSTVRIRGGAHPRLPVRTSAPVPKEKMLEVMALLDEVCVTAPVHAGDVLVSGLFGTEVSVIACKDM